MDRFTKVCLAAIVCLLALIAFELSPTPPRVFAQAGAPRQYLQVVQIKDSNGFHYDRLNDPQANGYQVVSIAGLGDKELYVLMQKHGD